MSKRARHDEELGTAQESTIQAWRNGEAWAGGTRAVLFGPPGQGQVIPLSNYQQGCFYNTKGVQQWKEAVKQMVKGKHDSPEEALIRTACCTTYMCELIRLMRSSKAHIYNIHSTQAY